MEQVNFRGDVDGGPPAASVVYNSMTNDLGPLAYLPRLARVVSDINEKELKVLVAIVEEKWRAGARFIICGNGGSALNALHIATDLGKAVRLKTGRPFLCQTLTDNVGLLTAFANDVSYEDSYAEQARSILTKDDVLVAISVSGNSPNVLKAVDVARQTGTMSVGLCGYDGGRLRSAVDHFVWIRSDDMQICEDAHMAIGHMLVQHLCSSV